MSLTQGQVEAIERADPEYLRGMARDLTAERDMLRAENERLRGLIVEMVESHGCRDDNPSWSKRADAALAASGETDDFVREAEKP